MKPAFTSAASLSCLLPFSILLLSSFLSAPQIIERFSATITTRQVQQGKSVTVKGEVFYQRNGSMVTRFVSPREVVILANKLGETRIYDPNRNTVIRYQNAAYSSQTTQLAFFLNGMTSDMGLLQLGFVQDKTMYDAKNRLVTEWKPKTTKSDGVVRRVKLVFSQGNPIYMHYLDGAGKIFRKVFYYNYQLVENRPFPTTTTEILYSKGDSTVSKTAYSDIRLNQVAQSPYFNFSIPSTAKTE